MNTDEQQNPEIITKLEDKTQIVLDKIAVEQAKALEKIEKETEARIKKIRDEIISQAKEKANNEFLREKAKHESQLRLKKTSSSDEMVNELVEKGKEKLIELTQTERYKESIIHLIKEATVTLQETEIIVHCRQEDTSFINKEFLENIAKEVQKEVGYSVNFILSDKFIKSIGGVVLENSNGKIKVDNSYEKKIERSLEDIKREISVLLLKE